MKATTIEQLRAKYPLNLDCEIYIGPGWVPIIDALCEKIQVIMPNFTVQQIKEKFGGLRFYITYGSDEIFKLIDEAEKEAWTTCEQCGSKENIGITAGWLQTVCRKCYESPDYAWPSRKWNKVT